MGLACVLGLTACLSFGGHQFTAEDAVAILDECEQIKEFPLPTFMDHPASDYTDARAAWRANLGVLAGRSLEEKGLTLDWPQSLGGRKVAWLRTCRQFEIAFYDRGSGWSHLEKWPW
mgnify:CR=1 FL=1